MTDWIARLPQNAYVTGSLLLDDIEDVQLPIEVESYTTLRVFGGQLELSNARLSQIMSLQGFWITTGKVIVKIRAG